MDLTIAHAWMRIAGMALPYDLPVDPRAGTVHWQDAPRAARDLAWEPPVDGAVYGALLNFRDALAALGEAVSAPPYKAAPKAPILFIKPRNTRSAHLRPIVVPTGTAAVSVGANLAIVIGRVACRLSERDALDHVAGYAVANDVSVPHDSYYRPSVRFKCRDGSCPLGPWVIARRLVADPDALAMRVAVDGVVVQESNTRGLVRSVRKLLADVTEFMTLSPGDVLLAGTPAAPPLVRPGQRVAITIDAVGTLENPVAAEGTSR